MPDQHTLLASPVPPEAISLGALADLLQNVVRGHTLLELHERMMLDLFEPKLKGEALRARLLARLTELRVVAAAVAGVA